MCYLGRDLSRVAHALYTGVGEHINPMIKRLREWLDAIDFKSILITTVLLTVLAGLLYLCTYLDEDHDDQFLAGQSNAVIISIEPVDMMHQGKYGTKIYTDSYKITYGYVINSRHYVQSENVKVRARNEKLLDEIFGRSANDSIKIKYDNVDPRKSRIVGIKK